MKRSGHCLCGAVCFEVSQDPQHVVLCHCGDCRRSAGAPMVSWGAFPEASLTVTKGEPKTIHSSALGVRSFCGNCGTGLFYRNEKVLPGIVDIQTATFDDPNGLPPMIHIQTAERLTWLPSIGDLPEFERYPG